MRCESIRETKERNA